MGVEFVFCDEKGKVVDCISGCKSLWYGYEQKTPKFDYNQSLKDVAGLDDKALDSQGMRAFAADIHYYLEEEFPWVLRKEDAEVYKPDLERLKELVEAQNFTELLAFYERELEVVKIFEYDYSFSQILKLREFRDKLMKYAEVENMYACFSR